MITLLGVTIQCNDRHILAKENKLIVCSDKSSRVEQILFVMIMEWKIDWK